MKELDVVKLTREFEGLPAGTKGTIVLEYDGLNIPGSEIHPSGVQTRPSAQ